MTLDEFAVMPNHLHGILALGSEEGTHGGVPLHESGRMPSLGDIVGWFKSITSTDYMRGVERLDWPLFHQRLWQRNYYEQIIRNDAHLERLRAYIVENPAKWHLDDDHPSQIPAVEYRS